MMTHWQRVWRHGLAPLLSRAELIALESALISDDRRLLQGSTCCPLRLDGLSDPAPLGACALGWCGWQGDGLQTIAQIEAFFARLCEAADATLGEPAACRYFLNWYDDTPRTEMRRELLAEVRRTLGRWHPLAA